MKIESLRISEIPLIQFLVQGMRNASINIDEKYYFIHWLIILFLFFRFYIAGIRSLDN